MKRRELIRWMLSATAWLPVSRVRLGAQEAVFTATELDTLRALAEVSLPSELGAPGRDAVVQTFVKWLDGYRSGAEMSHGYGATRAALTPAISIAGYRPQLAELERRAQAEGRPFTKLDPKVRSTFVERLVDESGIKALPMAPTGQHVIVDFLAFYFRSSQANDLCYKARIGRDTCRGLAGSAGKPQALALG